MARKAQLSATFQVDGRCRADFAFGARIVPLGRVGSLQRTQTSGAPPARRPPGWRAAPSPRSMRTRYQTRAARPQKWGVSAIRPMGFSMGAAAPIARSAPYSVLRVGSARRSGPKLQARSAVCEEHANSKVLPNKGGFAAKMGRLGDPSLPWAFR